jgi:hypothetical protein
VFGIVSTIVIGLMRSLFGLSPGSVAGSTAVNPGPLLVGASPPAFGTAVRAGGTVVVSSGSYFGVASGGGQGAILGFGSALDLANTWQVAWSSTADAAGTLDTGMKRVAAGVAAPSDGGAGAGWLQNTPGRARNTADVTNATVTFANLADLTLTLKAGRKYTGVLRLLCNDSVAADGVKLDFNGGTATMTAFAAGVVGNVQGATAGTTVSTSLAGAVNFTAMSGTGTHYIDVAVTLVVNAAGTFIPRFAQNAHTTGTATALTGSYLWLEDSPN